MGKTGKITSDVEGCFQWDINAFQQTWKSDSYVESPEISFCDKRYVLTLMSLKNIEMIMIHFKSLYGWETMKNFNIELYLCTERNNTSDQHRIVTHNTKFRDLRFVIDFREFLMGGKPLSDRLTIIFHLKQLSYHENLMDESYSMNKIQEDLKDLLASGEKGDVKLIVGEREFHVHRNILCARSPVFDKILAFGELTREDGALDIKDCDPDTFWDFLTYVYTGSIRHINNENVISLYTTAVAYGMVELKSACISFMRANMSVDVFCSRVAFALRYDEKELIEYSKMFFCMKAEEICETENWLNYLVKSPKEANEVFLKALAKRH